MGWLIFFLKFIKISALNGISNSVIISKLEIAAFSSSEDNLVNYAKKIMQIF